MGGELQQTLTLLSPIASTTLNGNVLDTDVTIVLTDASGFLSSGDILVEGDTISYTGKTGNTLTGVTGIVGGGHLSGVTVWQKTQTSVALPLAGVRRVFLTFTRAGHVSGTGTFSVDASANGTSWVAYNKILTNVTNANTEYETRVASVALSSSTSSIVVLDLLEDAIPYFRVAATISADGTSAAKATLEYF